MDELSMPLPELVLVEDDANDEEMSLRAIAQTGIPCTVTVHRDGHTAVEDLLDTMRLTPSVIILDYRLPKLTGRQILQLLRDNPSTKLTPVVIFSGTNAGAELTDCYTGGANSCVVKPDDAVDYKMRLASVTRYWLSVNQASHMKTQPQRQIAG